MKKRMNSRPIRKCSYQFLNYAKNKRKRKNNDLMDEKELFYIGEIFLNNEERQFELHKAFVVN